MVSTWFSRTTSRGTTDLESIPQKTAKLLRSKQIPLSTKLRLSFHRMAVGSPMLRRNPGARRFTSVRSLARRQMADFHRRRRRARMESQGPRVVYRSGKKPMLVDYERAKFFGGQAACVVRRSLCANPKIVPRLRCFSGRPTIPSAQASGRSAVSFTIVVVQNWVEELKQRFPSGRSEAVTSRQPIRFIEGPINALIGKVNWDFNSPHN